MEAQRHVSLQVFLQHLFSFSPVICTFPRRPLHKSLLESSCSNVQLIRTEHSAAMRHMLLGIFLQPCSHVDSEPWHGISRFLAHIFFTSTVSKRSKSFRQFISCNCSLVGVSCLLFSFTRASSHRIAIITPTIIIVMGCDESGKPMESSSPQSQINTRLLRPGYHHVCSKQWQGNSSCVDMMLLQLRFNEAPVAVPLPSSLGGFHHSHPLHCNL